ncbi:MAG: tetratricopeptide repeat protein [Desulfovibrionales bacterium]
MSDKITVYEEILAQDPNARIFFPLAKMYRDAGRSEDAVNLLQKGLSSHPEHLEAKCLQIELLIELGKAEEARAQSASIIDILSRSSGLWALWAERSEEEGNGDLSLALRFVAESLSGKSMSWSEIFLQGLNSLSSAATKRSEPSREAAGPAKESLPFEDDPKTDFLPEPEDLPVPEPAQPKKAGPVAEEPLDWQTIWLEKKPVPTTFQETPSKEYPEFEPHTEMDVEPWEGLVRMEEESEPAEFTAQDFAENSDSATPYGPELEEVESILEAEVDAAQVEEAKVEAMGVQSELEAIAEEEAAIQGKSGESPLDQFEDHADEQALEENEEEEDVASEHTPKTMTMAHLLADQGDFERALDIYTALWRAEPPGAGRRELEEQMQKVEEELDRRERAVLKARKAQETKAVVGLLENLAQRLESRA